MLRRSQTFGFCALIAVGLSCIGLLALTSATAERRTKEISIRKALGADTGDMLSLLLWQFSKPVVWGCLLAWPAAGYVMDRWLATFAYHIELPLLLFPEAAVAALIIALATVAAQSVLIARAKPVVALRYEYGDLVFRNCLAAALRHLAQNKLYTAIGVMGLAVGLSAALLAALVVHDRLSQDHFIPGYDRIYMVVTAITPPGSPTMNFPRAAAFLGPELALKFSEIQAVTRLVPGTVTVRHANAEVKESVYWADATLRPAAAAGSGGGPENCADTTGWHRFTTQRSPQILWTRCAAGRDLAREWQAAAIRSCRH